MTMRTMGWRHASWEVRGACLAGALASLVPFGFMLSWAVAGEEDRPGQAMALMPLLAFWVAYYLAVVPGLAALARRRQLPQRPLLMAMAVVSLAVGYPLFNFLGLTAAFLPAILLLAAAVPGRLYVQEGAA